MKQCILSPQKQPSYRDDHLYVDLRQQLVILDGETVSLTRMQYRLLAVLVEHAGVVVTRMILLLHIWVTCPSRAQACWRWTFDSCGRS